MVCLEFGETMKARRRYLTPMYVRSRLQPGTCLQLGYDDFNAATFTYRHIRTEVRHGRLECTGIIDFGDEPAFEGVLYEFHGPHRSPPIHSAILCRGSGAERVYIAQLPT